jgi:predicted phosphodiesterase
MHRDAAALVELMGSASVKLLVSGHIHLYDKVEYNAMTFVCDGALSGAWWKGPYHETPAGFGVFDLYPDGRFTNVYRALDWKPKPR